MPKITKKSLMEDALKKYSKVQIEEAISCKVKVALKKWNAFWDSLWLNLPLTNRWKKPKIEKIRTWIRSLLLNIKPDESNKRLIWNTSSDNIESIKISLKYK